MGGNVQGIIHMDVSRPILRAIQLVPEIIIALMKVGMIIRAIVALLIIALNVYRISMVRAIVALLIIGLNVYRITNMVVIVQNLQITPVVILMIRKVLMGA